MISIFASKIPGMRVDQNVSRIVSRIIPPQNPIGVSDLKFAQNIIKKFGTYQKVKGIITGPTTLVHSSRIEGFYKSSNKEKAILDLAEALKREALYLEDAGAEMIQIDEPFLSTGIVNVKTARKAVNMIADAVNVPIAIHVCGDIKEVFKDLLSFKVDIIDCEFAGNIKNLEYIENIDLKGKKIGFGCIDTKSERIEEVEEIQDLIKRGCEIIDEEDMIIDPDCGMRKLPRKVALSKLINMVEAAHGLSYRG